MREDLIGQRGEGHADGDGLQAAGRRRLDAEHAADLRDVRRRAGVQVAASSCGGLAEIEKRNIDKAKLLYDYLDSSDVLQEPGARRKTARA